MSEYVKLDDTVRFGAVLYNVSGIPTTADETPNWYLFEEATDAPILNGAMTERTNIIGSYRSTFNATLANGLDVGSYYEIHVSGTVDGISSRAIVKTFVLGDIYDVNIIQVSGENISLANQIDTNVIQVSGNPVHIDNFKADVSNLDQDIYFANIKYISDETNSRDEYTASWFRNDQPLTSGDITYPAISVYNTQNGSPLFENASMFFASTNLGVVRYNESTNVISSGEPYLVVASGTIDLITRTWKTLIGIDLL